MWNDPHILSPFFKLLTRYAQENWQSSVPVNQYLPPSELKTRMDFKLKEEGCSEQELLGFAEKYLSVSPRTTHKRFLNQLFWGGSTPAILGDLLTSIHNTSMATYEIAPAATLMENEVLDRMCSLVGYPDGEGTFVTGGANANLVALLAARDWALPDTKTEGLFANRKLVFFVSELAHYSYRTAAVVSGVGLNNIIKVPVDPNGSMVPRLLEKEILSAKSRGLMPFMIGATSGTTVTGSFDPLGEISRIAKEHRLWLHADASLGGSTLLSKKHRTLMHGCEHTDSIAWDAHKLLGAPLICSTVLFRERGTLFGLCNTDFSDYLFHDHDLKAFDLGRSSLQCGRRPEAVKLWFQWKAYGESGLRKTVDTLFDLAQYATQKLRHYPALELTHPVQSITVCFRYVPKKETDINQFNLKIREELKKRGLWMVNYATLNEKLTLRLVLINHHLGKEDVDHFFEAVVTIGQELESAL